MKRNHNFENEIKKYDEGIKFRWNDWGQVTFSLHANIDMGRAHYCFHENGVFEIHFHTLEYKPLYKLLSNIDTNIFSFREGKDVREIDGVKRDYWYGYITIEGSYNIDNSFEGFIAKYKEVQGLISESLTSFLNNFKKVNTRIWFKWRGDGCIKKDYITTRCSVKGIPTCDYKTEKDFIQALKQKDIESSEMRHGRMYWRLNELSQVGDIIIGFNQKGKNDDKHILIYGWGYITSKPFTIPNSDDDATRISVHWEKTYDTPIRYNGIKDGYFINHASIDNIIELTELLNITENPHKGMDTNHTKYQDYINLLKENYNLILTGAPGTGKTFMAKAIAEEMGAETEFVQFHPSYDYTDFVEGLRPVKGDGLSVGFERKDGIFKEFCKKAILENVKKDDSLISESVQEKKPYVMIIDEINRGELSKIFGELFYAIDPGYRGEDGSVKTQYQNLIDESDVFAKGFYIPDNVYILATMNDIDRSVESMDFAMRRRFTWKEVTPEDRKEMLDEKLDAQLALKAKATMQRLNQEIAKTDGLGEAFMVGPSYFLKLEKYGDDFDKLWKLNIMPLLKEYLRGFRKADDELKKFEVAFFNESVEQPEQKKNAEN